MIGLPLITRIWLAAGFTDLRRSMDGLAALVQGALEAGRVGQRSFPSSSSFHQNGYN